MYRILVLAAAAAMAVARPELYKEQEDFKFSRTSSDEGAKSGYYGAQRGNMGGNYERAHNMDSLAQNQMSGLVRQVEGELGDGANTRTGSVYSAANSRGTYGSGHYDLSNLAGRNFQEGTYYGSSNSHAAQTHSKSTFSNAGTQNYDSSRYGGYQRATADAHTQTDDLQSLDNSQTNNQLEYGRSSSHSSGYQSQSGFQKHSEYDSSIANSNSGYGSNVRTRLVSASPVRIILTPGRRVAVPIAAQTYDAAQASSAFNHNAINSEAEINQKNQGSSYVPTNEKNYESSYSYNKKWEKHDTKPSAEIVVGNTASPIPRNSELYEDSEAHNQFNSGVDSNSASGRYNALKSSSNSRYQSNFNTRQRSDSAISSSNAYDQARYHAGSNHDASASTLNNYRGQYGSRHRGVSSSSSDAASQTDYNAGSHSDLNSQVEDLNLKPKSYQSSYSYHKSWERQGDPYTIYPASNGYSDSQSSQRLSSLSQSASHHSQVSHSHGLEDCDCDENGHIRIARSHNTGNDEQQSQNEWGNLEDLTQQSQSNWDQLNEGQQTQERLEDLNQQSQSNWVQHNSDQQTQDVWENLEDLNQQSQSTFDQQSDVQQSQANWDKVEDLAQQIHTYNEEKNSLNKLVQNKKHYGKQTSNSFIRILTCFQNMFRFPQLFLCNLTSFRSFKSKVGLKCLTVVSDNI